MPTRWAAGKAPACGPRVLLDTHVLVGLVNGDTRLAPAVCRLIDEAVASAQVWVSAITPCDIGMLMVKGRLALARHVDQWL